MFSERIKSSFTVAVIKKVQGIALKQPFSVTEYDCIGQLFKVVYLVPNENRTTLMR